MVTRMADINFWTRPADRMVRGGGHYNITVLQPPFAVRAEDLPPNDPVAARAFAEAFPTVDAVLEELDPVVAYATPIWRRARTWMSSRSGAGATCWRYRIRRWSTTAMAPPCCTR